MPTPPQVPTPPPIQAAPQIAGTQATPTVGELQAQTRVLTRQISGLSSERSGLMAQLRSGSVADRASTIGELDRVNHQLAISTGQLANVRAQVAIREAVQHAGEAPRPNNSARIDPDVVAGLAFAFIFAVLMPIAIGYSRRLWRAKPREVAPRPDDLSGARLERLEQAVDSIAIEIERISEGQRFVTKVLADRMPVANKPAAAPAAQPVAVESPEPQLRALGAGPIEPIRVVERQAVTPH